MDWQNDEFETLLRKFRLREARPLTLTQPIGIVRRYRVKVAAAAALMLALGASAAIVRQRLVQKEASAPVGTIVEKIKEVPEPVAIESPVAVAAAAVAPVPSVPSAPQSKAPSSKPDPKEPEPLKELTMVVPTEPQDAGQLSRQDPTQPSSLEGQGRRIFLEVCGSCHVPDVIGNSHFDTPEEYSAIVNRMISIGATASPQEASAIVEFLFKTYGRNQTPAAADRGKGVFDAACGQCHSADLMDGRKDADKDAYRSIVNRMVGYGASVAPDQIDLLVEYLFRIYGRRLK